MANPFDQFDQVQAEANPFDQFDAGADPKPTGGLVAAAKQAIGATIKGAGQAASDFIPGVSKANPVTTYGQSVVDANPTAIQSLGDIAESPWQATKEAIGNAAGSMAGMVGGALGAKALGGGLSAAAPFTGPAAPIVGGAGKLISTFGPSVAPVVAAALPSYSGIREEQIKADPANEADARSKAIAALGAGTVGAIETRFGPQEWALSAMKKGGIESIAKKFADAKSIPGAIGKGILHGGAVEGAEELVQNPIEQLASYQDPTTRQAIGETLFGGAMGAIGGGVLGGGMAGVAKATNREQPSPQPVGAPVAVVPPPVTINPAAGPLQSATANGMQSGAVQQTQQQAIARASGIPATGGIASETAQEGQEGQGAMGVAQVPAGATGEPVPASTVAAPTGLAGAAVGTGNLPGESAAVAAHGDPFADAEFRQLATQEAQDVDARRHGIAQRQSLLRDARLEEIDGRVATQRQRDERDARMAIIDALPLMQFQNPVAAFESELQRQGFSKSGATAGERDLIQRRVQAESALSQDYQPIVEPSLPNELAMPERSPRAPSQTSASRVDSLVARVKSSPGARVKNGRLLNAHGKTLASGLTPAEVSALAPHITSKGIASRGNETQVAIPPASGQQAQPAPAAPPAAGVAPTKTVADRRAEYLAGRNFPSLNTPPQPTSGALPMEQQATPLTLPQGMPPKSVSGTSEAEPTTTPEGFRKTAVETPNISEGSKAENVDHIASVIHSSIANEVIKRAKKTSTPDRAAEIESWWKDEKPGEHTKRIAQAIADKNPVPLLHVLVGAYSSNQGTARAFEKLSGVSLRGNGESRAKAIFDWAGWSEQQVAEHSAEKRASMARMDEKRAAERASKLADAMRERKYRREDGSVVSAIDLIDERISQGYSEIREGKQGAAKTWVLTNPETRSGYRLRDKHEADYAANRLAEKSAVVSHETATDATQADLSLTGATQPTVAERRAELLAKRNSLASAADRLSSAKPDTSAQETIVADASGRMQSAARKSVVERRAEFEALRGRFVAGMEGRRQQTEAQHIEGKTVEPATAAVVTQAVAKGERNSGRDLRQEQGELLKQIDEAIAKAPKAYDDAAGFVTFDVPGDGKFKIRNNAIRLSAFRKQITGAAAAGFRPEPKRAAHKTPMQKIEGGKASQQTIREMISEGDLTAALELSKVAGTPMVFGNYASPNRSHPIPYTDSKAFSPSGFGEIPMVSARSAEGSLWHVILTDSGLSLSSGSSRDDAEAKASSVLKSKDVAQLREQIANAIKGKVKDQSALEAEWVKWAEQEEYAKDNAAELEAKRNAAKEAEFVADRAKWEELTGEKPSIATFSPANPFSSGQMTTTNVLDGYEKARKNGKGAEFIDYAESKLDSEVSGHKPVLDLLRRLRSTNAGEWRYRGNEAPGGLPRYERTVKTADGREIRATLDGDISTYGFVREDDVIKARIGDVGSLTFQQAQAKADEVIDALMVPLKDRSASAQVSPPKPYVPPAVTTSVQRALGKLRDIEQILTDVEKASGKGHILALEVRDQQDAINAARAKLDQFRSLSKAKGIDADAIISEMGGEPDFARFGEPAESNGKQYRYALVNRPASMGAVPKVQYTIEPRPPAGQPHHDLARHGIMVADRKLTDDEIKAFELAPIADDEMIADLAKQVADNMGEYAAEYIDEANSDRRGFDATVGQQVDRLNPGVRYSIGDRGELADKVLEILKKTSSNAASGKGASIASLQAKAKDEDPFSNEFHAALHAAREAVTADAKSAIGNGEMPIYDSGGGVFVGLSPSSQNPGMVQATRYRAEGIIGDSQYKDVESAISSSGEGLALKRRLSDAEAEKLLSEAMKGEAEYQARKAGSKPAKTEPEKPVAANDDLRGYAYAIVKDGRILTSGSFPAPEYMPNGDDAKLSKWVDEAKRRGADLYIGGYPGAAAWKPQDGLIFGMTFDEIQAKQLKKSVPPASIRHAMPKDAVMVFNGQNPESAPAKPAKPEPTLTEPIQANTEDAGAELTYNRRNRLTRGLKWEDIASKDEALRVKEATKAKVYPKPDYKAMIDSGMRPQLAHIVKQVYDSIATSPQTRRSAVPTDDDIKSYIAGVNRVMDSVTKWAGDSDRGGKWFVSTARRTLQGFRGAIDITELANVKDDGESLLSAAFPNGYEPVRNELVAIGGNKVYGALQPGGSELNDAVKATKAGWPESQESWQRQGITVVNGDDVKAETSEASYGKQATIVRFTIPNGTFSRSLKVVTVEGTRDAESPEVRKAIDDGLAEYSGRFLLLNKVKSVVSTHATEDEAKDAARALVSREGRKNTVSDKGISVTAAERIGDARRLPGEDISSDRLRDTFKFKGINFGNWMKGDANAKERQLHLNHAYDSFMDLADVLGVPPEAMSLNGMLGVAIGAQGSGGFATAHFVPGVNEINLTRESGAGALAHEWGHALDHYFARQSGLTRATDPFLTEHLKTAEGSEIRPEILDKFKAIVQAMHRRPITPEEAAAQRKEKIASARRNLDGWLNSIVSTDKREDADIMRAVDRIKSGDLGDGSVAVGRTSAVKPAIAEFGKIIKEKTGRVLQRTDMSAIDSWASSLKYLQSQADEDATHVPQQMVETNYSKDAASLDKEKGGKRYWSTSLEMFARAFDAFISDTLEAKAAKNTYLSHAGRDGKTVPTGTERTTINKAIQGLVDAIETKPGENGNVVLFNADTDAIAGSTADRAIYDMAQEGKSAADILSFIGKASRRPFNRYLANALRNLGVAPAVTLDAQGGWKFNQGKPGAKYAAAYNPKTDTIALFTPRDAERHLLHEMVHGATLKAIAKGGPASMRMRALYAHVQKSGALAGQYGMSNLDEFVAEAFTNPKFQDALKAIPAPAGSKLQNAWRWFVQAVARILGMRAAAQETALDRALTLGGGLMRENAALSRDVDGVRGSATIAEQQRSGLTSSRINDLFINYAYINNDARTKAYLGWVSPEDFLQATASKTERERIASESSPLDEKRLAQERQDIFLRGRIEKGKFLTNGHEGRHRMHALQKAGVEQVPVVFYLIDGKEREPLQSLRVTPQDFGDSRSASGFTANSLIPINYENEEAIRNEFGSDERIMFNIATDWISNQFKPGQTTKVIDDSGNQYTPEQRAMFERTGRVVDVKTMRDHVDELRKDWAKKLAQGIVDQFAPIKDLSKEAYGLLRLSKGASGAFEVFMRGGQLKLNGGAYDFDETKKGGVIDRLLTPLQNESGDFMWWVAANRAGQLKAEAEAAHAKGAQLRVDANEALARAVQMENEAKQRFQQAGDFPKAMMGNQQAQSQNAKEASAMLAQAKSLRAEAAALREKASELMAINRERLFSDADVAAGKTLANGQTKFDYTLKHDTLGHRSGEVTRNRKLVFADSLKTFNDFNRNALDMAEQSGLIDPEARKIWEREFYIPFYRVADDGSGIRGTNVKSGVVRQEAFKRLKGGTNKLNSDLLENTLNNWAHLIDAAAKNRAAVATLDAAAEAGAAEPSLKSGLDWQDGKVVSAETGNVVGDGSVKPEHTTAGKGTVWAMRNGKQEHYTVSDPYVLTAISALEYAGLRGGIMDVMGAFKRALTMGVTASPFFKVRNLIRDSLQAIGTSEIGYNPLANIKEGYKATNRGTDEYFHMLAGGGLIRFGTMLEGGEAARTRNLVEKGVDPSTILDDESKVKAFYKRSVEPLVEAYNELGNRGEEVTRAALYKQLVAKGMSHAEASLEARDLMDFSMQGSFTAVRFLTQVVPFMNARLQGLYKLGRAHKENPKRFYAVLGATALFSLALMAAYDDDDDWKKREDWDRDNYWWFKVGGTAIRIPKPFEIGALASLAERSAELAFNNEMTGQRFRSRVMALLSDNLSMNPIPQMVKPLIDIYANKDAFTGRPIESMGMEKLDPDYRFRQSTSMVARGVSTAGNAATGGNFLSPVQVDHLVQGYLSWLGAFVVGGASMIASEASSEPDKPSRDMWKIATGGMISELDGAPSRYVTQMYEQAKQLEQAYGTYRHLQKEGKIQEAAQFALEHRDDLARYRGVEAVKRAESKMNERIRAIERGSLSSDDKRERINTLRAIQDRYARTLSRGGSLGQPQT